MTTTRLYGLHSIDDRADYIADLFTKVLVPAEAHKFVSLPELREKAKAVGVPIYLSVMDDAGYPCYAGPKGTKVIMGVQFK